MNHLRFRRLAALVSGLLASIILTAGSASSTKVRIKLGPEFVFTNNQLSSNERAGGSRKLENERLAAKDLSSYLLNHVCPKYDCKAEKVEGKFGTEWRFNLKFKRGKRVIKTYVQVSWDPNVVEVLMPPHTIKEMGDMRTQIQKFLFDSAEQIGIEPTIEYAGHVNMGIESAFAKDAELFLRFFVDHANHPEWDLGTFGYDIANAPPLSILPEEQSLELVKIVEEFKAGRHQTIEKLAYQIQKRVYKTSSVWNAPGDQTHYQAMGLKSISSTKILRILGIDGESLARQRVEFRGSYGQLTYLVFVRYGQFLEKRIEYLKKQRDAGVPIVFTPSRLDSFPPDELAELFEHELDKMGLDRGAFIQLLEPSVQGYTRERVCADLFKVL